MHKNGEDRYKSCEEFKKALYECLSTSIEEGKKDQSRRIIEKKHSMKIITVGREVGNDIVISNDPFVGRHHLKLFQDDAGVFFVRDLNSTNGTFVNGKRIAGEKGIDKNDIIRIGNTTIPWISYFMEVGDTEIEQGNPKNKRNGRKATSPNSKDKKEKLRKSFSSVGKWLLRTLLAIGTSIIMMIIFRIIMKSF